MVGGRLYLTSVVSNTEVMFAWIVYITLVQQVVYKKRNAFTRFVCYSMCYNLFPYHLCSELFI